MTDSKVDKTMGEIIAEARKQAGLSLRAVAARIPIHFTYLADIEKNRRVPSEKVLLALSELSELNLDFDLMMAVAGRIGEEAENYIKKNPQFGRYIRQIVSENLDKNNLDSFISASAKLTQKTKKK